MRHGQFRYTGHRGAMGYTPENTLESFERAILDGVDEVELDLQLTADGRLVIMHDSTVDRTTDGYGPVAAFTLGELRQLDAGNRQPVPTFEEALELITVKTLVEIKSADVVQPLVDFVRTRGTSQTRIDITSFDARWLEAVRRALPEVRTALLCTTGTCDLVKLAASIGASWVGVGWDGSTESLVNFTHDLGLEYCLWPGPTHGHFDRAIAMGADGITTDYPRLIAERGARAARA